MTEEDRFDAGVFALLQSGWVLVKCKSFPTAESANGWMDRIAGSQLRSKAILRVRSCIIEKKPGATFEKVLAEYERNRANGLPEFNAPQTTEKAIKPRGKVRAGISERQGQYLAFIHLYTQLNGQAPGELDMQRYFRVSPPSVHDMILMLERKGLISRTPGVARSVRVLVPKEKLPELKQVDR
jgi:repressor LexA